MRKLVRDKYKDIISCVQAKEDERYTLLYNKMIEELNELRETGYADVEEWCDVFEVLKALILASGVNMEEIEERRIEKYNERGGFETLQTFYKE